MAPRGGILTIVPSEQQQGGHCSWLGEMRKLEEIKSPKTKVRLSDSILRCVGSQWRAFEQKQSLLCSKRTASAAVWRASLGVSRKVYIEFCCPGLPHVTVHLCWCKVDSLARFLKDLQYRDEDGCWPGSESEVRHCPP